MGASSGKESGGETTASAPVVTEGAISGEAESDKTTASAPIDAQVAGVGGSEVAAVAPDGDAKAAVVDGSEVAAIAADGHETVARKERAVFAGDLRTLCREDWFKLHTLFNATQVRRSAEMQQIEANLATVESRTSAVEAAPKGSATDPAERKTLDEVRILQEMMSLKPSDDERTEVSKKISWILRHGAKKASVDIDSDGWVPLSALIGSDILSGISEERLMTIVRDSNQQKLRYELKTEGGQVTRIRAVSKSRRREKDREQREEKREKREARRRGEDEDRPVNSEDNARPSAVASTMPASPPHATTASTMTFEEQLQQGFRPVYQGDKILAMCRGDEIVRVGPSTNPHPLPAGRLAVGAADSKGGRGAEDTDQRGGKSKGDHGKGGNGFAGVDRRSHMPAHQSGAGGGFLSNAIPADSRKGAGSLQGQCAGGQFTGAQFGAYFADGQLVGGQNKGGAILRPPSDTLGRPRAYWRVAPGQSALVRHGENIESRQVASLLCGMLVEQLSEDKVTGAGIVRMMVECLDPPHVGLRGWVTRTAVAAGGPVFFMRERGPGKAGCGESGGSGGGSISGAGVGGGACGKAGSAERGGGGGGGKGGAAKGAQCGGGKASWKGNAKGR